MLGNVGRCSQSFVFSCSRSGHLVRAASTRPPLGQEIERIRAALYILQLEDWYNVPKSHLKTAKAAYLLNQYPTVEALVKAVYPSHPWEHERFAQIQTANSPQLFMSRVVRSVFPSARMEVNSRMTHGLMSEINKHVEIDLYLPDYKLGFEYQDPHHYFFVSYGIGSVAQYQSRDLLKREQASHKGITLISIPFWWDWDRNSLIATIQEANPNVLPEALRKEATTPIPQDPPQHILDKFSFEIPGLGVPMMASHPPIKHFSPTNWLLFEKYDGVRAIWHGKERQFYSRWGKLLPLPMYIQDTILPDMWLDGEVWFGRERGTRYQATKISRAAAHLVSWNKCQYMVFDTPQPSVRKKDFVVRYQFLKSKMPDFHPFVQLATYEICRDRDHVETTFFKIRSKGGEGIIMRDPEASYMGGYSQVFYKHKGFNDAEAQVLEIISEKKFMCRVKKAHLTHNLGGEEGTEGEGEGEDEGHYDVEMVVDDLFDGDTSEISVGSFVSFKYIGISGGIGPPQAPKIYTIRNDVTNWNQILYQKRKPPETKIWSPRALTRWTPQLRRQFLENFAKERDGDPLSVTFWYSITSKDIETAGGKTIMNSYPTYLEALQDIFPELKFDALKFRNVGGLFWNKESVRRYFETIAKEKGFDPLVAENWYTITKKDFPKLAGLRVFGQRRSHARALIAAFPDIGLRLINFPGVPKKDYWLDKKNVRNFLNEFAAHEKFDPLVPENWYNSTYNNVHMLPGGDSFMAFYNHTYINGVVDGYPELHLAKHKFRIAPRNYFATIENRRILLTEFAQENGFEPHQAEKWYHVEKKHVLKHKGGHSVLGYYNTLADAVIDSFPNIGLVKTMFKFQTTKKQDAAKAKS